jgi:hypothetical protein
MSDVSGVDNLTSSSAGDVSLTGIKSAIDNLNAGKAESSAVVPNTRQVAGHALSADVTLAKGDVGLGNVDNTSDTTKNAAAVTLTNKTIAGGSNTISGITEAMQTLADNTTGNVSTSAHGYVPKAPNTGLKFLRDDASWAGASGLISASAANSAITIPVGSYGNIVSITIPANILGTSGIVVMRIRVSIVLIDGSASPVPFKIVYGGSAISTFTATGSSSSTYEGWLEVFLQGSGATGTQNIMGSLIAQTGAANSGGYFLATGYINGTTSVDSTSSQTLAIQASSSNGNPSCNVRGYYVTKL